MARWERRQAEERAAKALKDSTEELLGIIEDWAAAQRREAFFTDAFARANALSEPARTDLLGRLQCARTLIGSTDTVTCITKWKSPEER
jgi:hypothetical protein